MKKPYALSTLKRLYTKLNLQLEPIGVDAEDLNDYIQACANFYQVIEAEEVWKMMFRALPKSSKLRSLTREQFDTFLSIAARDAGIGYSVLPEKEFYCDGCDDLFIVVNWLIFSINPDFSPEEIKKFGACVKHGIEYCGPSPLVISYDGFYALQEQREGKSLYVPKNILDYLDEDYYEKTPQTVAMKTFLRKVMKIPSNEIRSIMFVLLDDICDARISTSEALQKAIEEVEASGKPFKGDKQVDQFMQLWMDLNNNTRLPANRGFTPLELRAKDDRRLPPRISFGPGIQKSIQEGRLDAQEFREMIQSMGLPSITESSMLEEINKALLAKGEN